MATRLTRKTTLSMDFSKYKFVSPANASTVKNLYVDPIVDSVNKLSALDVDATFLPLNRGRLLIKRQLRNNRLHYSVTK